MEIKQKKFSTHQTFTFNEDHLNYAFKDKTGSDDFDLNYANFPEKSSVTIEQNEWLRNVGILWCLLGTYSVGSAAYKGLSLSGTGFWLFVGVLCIIWFALTKIKYSVFKTEAGNVLVMNDKNHDKIISEIVSRKKTQLLKWYGDINFDNDLENEINKFNWLAEQKVITKEEAEKKIAEVEFSHKNESTGKSLLN